MITTQPFQASHKKKKWQILSFLKTELIDFGEKKENVVVYT